MRGRIYYIETASQRFQQNCMYRGEHLPDELLPGANRGSVKDMKALCKDAWLGRRQLFIVFDAVSFP